MDGTDHGKIRRGHPQVQKGMGVAVHGPGKQHHFVDDAVLCAEHAQEFLRIT